MLSSDFQLMEDHSAHSDSITTKIFEPITRQESADTGSVVDVEMYNLDDPYTSAYMYDELSMAVSPEDTTEYHNNKPVTTVTTDLRDLTSTLSDSDEGLADWRLNEVFQDLLQVEMDSELNESMNLTNAEMLQHPSEPSTNDYDDDYVDIEDNTRDLLAEGFGTAHLYDNGDEKKEYTELVPATISELTEEDASSHSSNSETKLRRSSRNVSKTNTNRKRKDSGKVTKKGKQPVLKLNTDDDDDDDDGVTYSMYKVKPHETTKQAIRRVKNNLASRDFRSRKKNKLSDLLTRAEELEEENYGLRNDVTAVEDVVRILKEGLVTAAKGLRA